MPAFSWTTDVDDAKSEQRHLRDLVRLETALPPSLEFEKGVAIGSAYDENSKRCLAVGVLFDSSGRYSKKEKHATVDVDFPYIPGLLAFRVGPAICKLLDEVIEGVDLLLFDGQGIAHRRGLGLAAHIGVLYDKPSIGVTRNNLYGDFTEPPAGRFNRSQITDPRTARVIGYAVSLGEGCDPCYLSPGHKVSLDDAFEIVCRISGDDTCFPRPIRRAHAIANSEARILGEHYE